MTIHKLLITRLVISTIVISFIVSGLAFYYAKERVSEIAVERALEGATNISVLSADIINEPGLPRRGEIQALLNRYIPYQTEYASGEYIYVVINALNGTEIARLVNMKSEVVANIQGYLCRLGPCS